METSITLCLYWAEVEMKWLLCTWLTVIVYLRWPACENWNFSSSDYHTVSVLWNNAFRRIFNCCWRESTSVLQLYCGCLPMKYIIEQQTVLFYRRILRGSNVVLRSLLYQKVGYVQSLLSKFNIQSLSCPKNELKLHIWNTFVSETMCRGH